MKPNTLHITYNPNIKLNSNLISMRCNNVKRALQIIKRRYNNNLYSLMRQPNIFKAIFTDRYGQEVLVAANGKVITKVPTVQPIIAIRQWKKWECILMNIIDFRNWFCNCYYTKPYGLVIMGGCKKHD